VLDTLQASDEDDGPIYMIRNNSWTKAINSHSQGEWNVGGKARPRGQVPTLLWSFAETTMPRSQHNFSLSVAYSFLKNVNWYKMIEK